MAYVFDVTPEELKNSAQRIGNIGDSWAKEVDSIYAAVNELNVSYKGEASVQFNKQLEGYRNDFDAAIKALNEYMQFLYTYADDIQKTEDDLKQQAAQLTVGR